MDEALSVSEAGSSHLAVRVSAPGDEPFIFSSWLKSYQKARERKLADIDRSARLDTRRFYEAQDLTIKRLLRRCGALVVHGSANPSDIFGYLISEPVPSGRVVHWLYVKQVFRRMGLAGHLLEVLREPAAWMHSHETDAWRPLARRLGSSHSPNLSR